MKKVKLFYKVKLCVKFERFISWKSQKEKRINMNNSTEKGNAGGIKGMKIKKLLSIIISLAITASMLTACKNDESSTESVNTSEPTSQLESIAADEGAVTGESSTDSSEASEPTVSPEDTAVTTTTPDTAVSTESTTAQTSSAATTEAKTAQTTTESPTETTTEATTQAPPIVNAGSSTELAGSLNRGWNLSNTMESVATWLGSNPSATDFEKAWGQPKTTKAMIDGLKSAGITSVRVPIAWSNMMDSSYNISSKYFDRVDEIIGYMLDNNMYVIINIHWDGGWWEDFGSTDSAVREEAMSRYVKMWTQICEHYKNYSDMLIFESANEELGSGFKGLSENDRYNKTNEINQRFVDIVRSSGGNNSSRYLLIAGYDTDIDKTCDARFKMPNDSVNGKLMISVHYYTPSTFCIANTESNSWGYMDSWGTASDKEQLKKNFEKMRKFSDNGYGVIIGEYGVTLKDDNGTKKVKDGTYEFLKCVVEVADDLGFGTMLWDTGDWYNRNQTKFKNTELIQIYS